MIFPRGRAYRDEQIKDPSAATLDPRSTAAALSTHTLFRRVWYVKAREKGKSLPPNSLLLVVIIVVFPDDVHSALTEPSNGPAERTTHVNHHHVLNLDVIHFGLFFI